MKIKKDCKNEFSCFTIVELLVVISIIIVLASLLLPSLKQARAKGKQIACANNLKQAALAINFYINDNNAYLPPTQTDNSGGTGPHNYYWPDLLITYLFDKEQFFGHPQGGYRWDKNPFDCPSENLPSTAYGIYNCYIATTGGFSPRYSVYGANAKKVSRKFNISPTTALLFESPVDIYGGAVGFTTTTTSEGGSYWYGNKWIGQERRHGNGINWLFADSSVTWRQWNPSNSSGFDAEFSADWELQK
jgi:prepilin-type processing-associated H-X9-DG protein